MSPALALAWLDAFHATRLPSDRTDLSEPRRHAYDAFKKSYKEVAVFSADAT
jgi:hypothetical protein